jgi:hypothetical protein
MRQKPPEAHAHLWDPEQVEEFRRFLQTGNIAPGDNAGFGKRVGEIIQRAATGKPKKRWRDRD